MTICIVAYNTTGRGREGNTNGRGEQNAIFVVMSLAELMCYAWRLGNESLGKNLGK